MNQSPKESEAWKKSSFYHDRGSQSFLNLARPSATNEVIYFLDSFRPMYNPSAHLNYKIACDTDNVQKWELN